MAAGTAESNWFHLPAVAHAVFACVAVHCAGEFFNADGLSFNVSGCSANCERAAWVAVWCATDALGSAPFVGGVLGGVGATLEGLFGGRANFLLSMVLLDAVCGHNFAF